MDNGCERLIQKMIEWGDAINNGDNTIANRKYKTILALISKINKTEQIELIIKKLLTSSEVSVKYWAFITALRNHVSVDTAKSGLTEIANDLSTGPIGALAQISLIEWHKKETNTF
ncbi:MAG TPA: hypothetical protein PK040_09010 [Anaerolineaceae bacterium]|nr:hypothetical protein [Anaerolineaceae bacterium]